MFSWNEFSSVFCYSRYHYTAQYYKWSYKNFWYLRVLRHRCGSPHIHHAAKKCHRKMIWDGECCVCVCVCYLWILMSRPFRLPTHHPWSDGHARRGARETARQMGMWKKGHLVLPYMPERRNKTRLRRATNPAIDRHRMLMHHNKRIGSGVPRILTEM